MTQRDFVSIAAPVESMDAGVASVAADFVAPHVPFRNVQCGFEVDRAGRILRSRPGAMAALGLAASEVIGEYASELFVADDKLSARALVHRAARGGLIAPVLLRMRRADGAEIVVRVSARALDGSINVRIRQCDETERSAFLAGSGGRARFDALTGLPNRILLLERAREALQSGPQSLVLIDVDRLRNLVSALGTRAADVILVEVGDRLVAAMGAPGIVGLSGGQFVVLMPSEATPDPISTLITRIRSAIAAPLARGDDAVDFTVCLGIATASTGGDAEGLLADAEAALDQAKSLGPEHDAVFQPAFRRRARQQIELQTDLSRAISADEMRLAYQPIVALDTGGVVGYEALVPWQHPVRGLLAPIDFLDVAQRSGAGAAIDNWALVEACRQGSSWARAANPTTVCVNVTPERFAAFGLVQRVEHALALTGLDPARLVVEITEWSILVDVEAARETLAGLNGLGVRVALDDYGTGYSSLANVATLPVDELKIDTSFVAGLGSDRACTAIVRAIVGLGQALGITVVAEGVENAAQAFALRALGCEFGQGFHFGRPGSGPALIARTS